MRQNNFTSLIRPGVIAGACALCAIFSYTLYAAFPYLSGPHLSVTERTANGLTVLSGMTERISYLSINGAPVPFAEDGSFSATRAYPPGYTEVAVSVKDRFGRTLEKRISFINP